MNYLTIVDVQSNYRQLEVYMNTNQTQYLLHMRFHLLTFKSLAFLSAMIFTPIVSVLHFCQNALKSKKTKKPGSPRGFFLPSNFTESAS